MTENSFDLYYITAREREIVRAAMRRLYDDTRRLNADDMRDLAQSLQSAARFHLAGR